ncbi:hypothetical protein CLH04_004741 [Escherichia coli]|nr:hypothetical protein [Escherichia coli]EFE0061460.1 hypothetical protein [Escherichia coli]EFE0096490.1 hypothetical protein [Escherichia coli]EFE0146188.1 hypothetical protein [Escherichia coli]EFE0161261.1 hypothetical protein [Escherichia coli]
MADRKKRFRKNPSLGMGDWRFFISEPGIISIEDLPPGWGLLHVVNGRVRKVHGWPKGNCCWGNPEDKPFIGNKQIEKTLRDVDYSMELHKHSLKNDIESM